MALEKLVFGLKDVNNGDVKVVIDAKLEGGREGSYMYHTNIMVQEDVNKWHSGSRYDLGKRIFIDIPDGLDFLSPEKARDFMMYLSNVYGRLLDSGLIDLKQI